MKQTSFLKVYIVIGKILCSISGGIVGFFLGGPIVILPGVLAGFCFGYLFKKNLLSRV